MIRPEIKRILTFDAMKGKKIEEVCEKGFYIRIVFTDGSFVDLDTESTATAKIVIEKGKLRRERPFH